MFRTPSVTMDNRAGTSVMVRILPEPEAYWTATVGNRPDTPGDGMQLDDDRVSVVDSDQESSPRFKRVSLIRLFVYCWPGGFCRPSLGTRHRALP